jgi:glycerol-3-phosphate dehydrogenase
LTRGALWHRVPAEEGREAQVESYDVAVIGGGIIGCSAANHLTAAGFRTILMERGDIGGATSGRTSRLQYCGLSYFSRFRSVLGALAHPLESWESVELARRAMRDRSAFVRDTPERVHPITFYFPLHRDASEPLWKVRAGFALLERLDRGGVPLDIEYLPPSAARHDPLLSHLRDPDRLAGIVRYTEYQFDWPERICVDAAMHAEAGGATIANYRPVTGLAREGEGWTISSYDQRSGRAEAIRAKAVVNAAGVWVDQLTSGSRLPVPRLNQGFKGVNVVIRLPEPFRGKGFEMMTRGGEPFYVIPWDDLHYLGPRNRPHDGDPDGFRAAEAEVVDLIEEMNFQFPPLKLRREDVLYSWAGVRPRTARAGHPGGSSAVMLHDLAPHGLSGYYVYTGGLLMTHRAAGRSIAAAVARRTAPTGVARPVPSSARLFPANHNTPPIASAYKHVSLSDLRFAAAQEHVRDLDDLMFRRVRIGWSERMGAEIAHDTAAAVRDVMGWSPAEAATQAEAYIARLQRDFQLRV